MVTVGPDHSETMQAQPRHYAAYATMTVVIAYVVAILFRVDFVICSAIAGLVYGFTCGWAANKMAR